VPGAKKWCDGHTYCGWGQVTCGPDGKWKRKADGKLDCWELLDGRRPNTVCACYFTFFNSDCCERPDCIVPQGTNGQICPASAGMHCDYCNPMKSECKESGAKCLVAPTNETFCGRDCSGGAPCPLGSACKPVKGTSGYIHQCVPQDGSCYY
jgi:hypothetical protein